MALSSSSSSSSSSKKKSFTGSTMTLRDFHGGSIPSDLPLPSAPGVSARPPDRPLPATNAWALSSRPRPGSAGAASRAIADPPSSFLPHLGRHFDEDERKPFDPSAVITPRRPLPSSHTRPLTSPPAVPLPAFHPPSGPAPNAWAAKRDPTNPDPPPPSSTMLSGSRLLHASAIEKVSSGRWHSKPPPPDVQVIRFHEAEGLIENVRIPDDDDTRGTVVSPVYSETKERARSPLCVEVNERNVVSFYPDGARHPSSEGRFSMPQSPHQGNADVLERPKLKLLPKTKLQEPSESWILNDKQGSQTPLDNVHVENVHQIHGVMNVQKLGSTETDAGGRAVERPRLNLKPRSLPVKQSVESVQRERKTVFGGARPRELVLKERGIDNFDVNTFDVPSPTNRVRSDMLKIDPAAPAIVHGERADTTLEQRSRPDLERQDYRPNTDKLDAQRVPDNRRNSKDIKKPTEPRRQEPETWRKPPVEQPKLDDVPGPRFGKATSALELAQAFSRPVSDPRITTQSLPGRNQVPFSRLTDTREFYSGPAQRRINGY